MDNVADSGSAGVAPAPGDVVRRLVREVPDFPREGILFRDVMPVLADRVGLRAALGGLEGLLAGLRGGPVQPTHVVGMEARGFIFGAPLADRMGLGFVAARKPGKLPGDVVRRPYGLEYGENVLEVGRGLVGPGDHVVVVDDLLATGGTAECAAMLCRELGARVLGYLFLVELLGLGGRERLEAGGVPVASLVAYR